ncbi:Non-specific lipid-transfer protein 3 [Glycine soja]|nr:Non-specific lipid-transfer protein 3 [Glycine soja]
MGKSVVEKLLWMAIVCLVLGVISITPKAQAAVTCNQVVSNLTPCISYVLNGGKAVPGPCCNGIKTLFNLAHSTPDRQTVCKCIKNAVSAFHYGKSNVDRAAALPKQCGVNIPYQISPSTDCTSSLGICLAPRKLITPDDTSMARDFKNPNDMNSLEMVLLYAKTSPSPTHEVSSRSSRRSKSSPMFIRKKNTTTIETQTQEPSSSKVTCMGQVRDKRPSKQGATTKRDLAPTRCRCNCCWIRSPNNHPCRCKPLWPNFFRRKPTKLKHPSEPERNFHDQESELPFHERVNVDKDSDFASNSSTPPRNALLLTRCRSAPYRSSSLASRFRSSPVKDQETEFPIPNTTEQQHTSEEPQTEPELGFLREKIASLTEPKKVEEVETERRVSTVNRDRSSRRKDGEREVSTRW